SGDPGRRPPGEAVLPARSHREGRQNQGEAGRPLIGWDPALTDKPPEPGLPPFATHKPTSTARAAAEIPILIVVAALIAFVVKTFIAQPFYIPSESMVPQLKVNDRIVVSKLAYHFHG